MKERESGAKKKERTRRGRKLDSILQKNILEEETKKVPAGDLETKNEFALFLVS